MSSAVATRSTEQVQSRSLEISGSRQLTSWMVEQSVSLAFTTYQAGKVFFVGLNEARGLSVFERTFERCMGLCAHNRSLYMSSLYQLWRFENVLSPGESANGYDGLYLPQMAYITGDLDIHDVAVSTADYTLYSSLLEEKACGPSVVFVNTLFGCLSSPSETNSFRPIWHPPFLSKLAAEDRCHLNGLAMKDGKPAYVSAAGQSDVADGWRELQKTGGCVIDVQANEVLATGLSMPHSPRWYRGQLWVLNSGSGELGQIDLNTGRFEPVAFCPGFLRGLSFVGNFAVVGMSLSRDSQNFAGFPLGKTLSEKRAHPRCGLSVIDLRTGDVVHSVRIGGVVRELYDVVILPGVIRPQAVGIQNDEIRRVLSIEQT